MPQLLGLVDITWKGKTVPIEKGAKIKLGGLTNTAVAYGKTAGRVQDWVPSEITATTHLVRGQSFKDIYDVQEGELQVSCDTGQIFTFPDAFLTDRPEMTSGEGGKVELKWSAGNYEEILRNV